MGLEMELVLGCEAMTTENDNVGLIFWSKVLRFLEKCCLPVVFKFIGISGR